MNEEKFRKLIQKFGEENVVAIGFDNASIRMIPNGMFKYSEACDNPSVIVFVEYDIKGNPLLVCKPVDDVKFVMFREPSIPYEEYTIDTLTMMR